MHTLASRRSVPTPNSASLVRSPPPRLLLTRHRHPLHLTIPLLTATWPHPYQFLNLLHTRLPLLLHPRLLLPPHIPVALIVDLRLLLLGPITNNLPSPISLPLTRSCACTFSSTFALPCSIDFIFIFTASTVGRWKNMLTFHWTNSLNWNLSLRSMTGETFLRCIF